MTSHVLKLACRAGVPILKEQAAAGQAMEDATQQALLELQQHSVPAPHQHRNEVQLYAMADLLLRCRCADT